MKPEDKLKAKKLKTWCDPHNPKSKGLSVVSLDTATKICNEAVEDERNRCADLLEKAWKTGNTTWEELFESIKEGEK